MIQCGEDKAAVILQIKTLFGQSLVFKLSALKVANAETCFL